MRGDTAMYRRWSPRLVEFVGLSPEAGSIALMGETPSLQEYRARAAALMRKIQDTICEGIEGLEAEAGIPARFQEDCWQREGGGGGRTRVISGGSVFEKGGVNFSEVYGELSPNFAGSLPGTGLTFYATGISLVLHPHSPHVPTVHANFRHIQQGDKAWFGGGADLTPYYYMNEDREHFHRTWREVCERHAEVADYERFAAWCDRYFYIPHRKERRGVGGIFFDRQWVHGDAGAMDESRFSGLMDYVEASGNAFVGAYVPIARRHLETPVTAAQTYWHEIRRGRYAEFNLVNDRGTIFGLKTGGRTESILMSLPPRVRWDYGFEPEPETPEAKLLEVLRQPPPKPDSRDVD